MKAGPSFWHLFDWDTIIIIFIINNHYHFGLEELRSYSCLSAHELYLKVPRRLCRHQNGTQICHMQSWYHSSPFELLCWPLKPLSVKQESPWGRKDRQNNVGTRYRNPGIFFFLPLAKNMLRMRGEVRGGSKVQLESMMLRPLNPPGPKKRTIHPVISIVLFLLVLEGVISNTLIDCS